MATTNKTGIQASITAGIRTGNSDTTAAELRGILNEVLDSYANVVDGGLVYQAQVGYDYLPVSLSNTAFVNYQFMVDYVAANAPSLTYLTVDAQVNTNIECNISLNIMRHDIENRLTAPDNKILATVKNYFDAPSNELVGDFDAHIAAGGVGYNATASGANMYYGANSLAVNSFYNELIHDTLTKIDSPTINIGGTVAQTINYGNFTTINQHNVYGNWRAFDNTANNYISINGTSFMAVAGGINRYITLTSTELTLRHATTNIFNSPINLFNSGGAYFVSGIGIDTTATGGSDILNIGATNADVINIGRAGATINILGTALYEYAANQYVLDKLITLNYNGAAGSGIGVGFEVEAGGVIVSYLKTNAAQDGFSFKSAYTSYYADIVFTGFSTNRSIQVPDASGIIALISQVITNGVTTKAPSEDAVYDALLQKADKQDGLVSGGAITVGVFGANNVRVAAAVWYIAGTNYSTAGNTDFTVALAAAGLQRFTGFYGDNTNAITKVEGTESEYAVYPTTPAGKALIGYILVTDSAAASTPDLSGYLLIASKATSADYIAGTDNVKYITSSVTAGIAVKYQNLSPTYAATINTNVANYRNTFSNVVGITSTMTIAAPTGAPTNGAELIYRFKANGSYALTWNAAFASYGSSLPTLTVTNKVLSIKFVWDSVASVWGCVSYRVQP